MDVFIQCTIGYYNISIRILFIDLKQKDTSLISKIDYQGILLLATRLIALLIFLEEGERRDWFFSNFIFICFTIFILCLLLFFRREITYDNPVIDLKIFIEKRFFLGTIICCIFAINIYPPIFLVPILLTKMHHIDPIDIGLIISTMGIGMMIIGPIAGQLLKVYGEKFVIV